MTEVQEPSNNWIWGGGGGHSRGGKTQETSRLLITPIIWGGGARVESMYVTPNIFDVEFGNPRRTGVRS